MAILKFFSGKTLSPVKDLSNDIVNLSYTAGNNGSLSGTITVEETIDNASFLRTLKENSHFIKVGNNSVYGGIVETPVKDKNIWSIPIIGPLEYFDKIDLVSSNKADVSSVAVQDGDYSWIKIFYSDSAVGVLYEVLKNVKATLDSRGYSSSLLDISSLKEDISSNTDSNWSRSYRLNSLETPTLSSAFSDIIGDDDMPLLKVYTSQDLSSNFSIKFDVVDSADAYDINEAVDSIFNFSSDGEDVKRRAFSIAKGTDLSDRDVLERIVFDNSVAYSALISDSPQERSAAIKRFAETEANAAANNFGNLSFSSYVDTYDVLDFLTIGSAKMESVSGMITEKSLEGRVFTYTIQLGSAASFNGVLKKPNGGLRKIIFSPLKSTANLSRQTASKKDNSTGWRT